jgi:hypothetical protein
VDQGVNATESSAFGRAAQALLAHGAVHSVATRKDDVYEIHHRAGVLKFRRSVPSPGLPSFEILEGAASNPVARDDPTSLATLAEELAAGDNPAHTDLSGQGYPPGDPRVSFVRTDRTSFPYALERIAQYFDHPRAPDAILNPMPWGLGGLGEHGALDVTQSRVFLIFSGPGIARGQGESTLARTVDIAPTVLHLLGQPETAGVDATGSLRSGLLLKRQDGRVLREILSADAHGQARRAVLLLLDGLSHTELAHRLDTEGSTLPHFRELVEGGVRLRYGAITNYPSVTVPGHLSIGTGAWAGHHGVPNNNFYERATATFIGAAAVGAAPARWLMPDVETLFDAFHRAFGSYDAVQNPLGPFTASVNELTTRGASFATLEMRTWGYSLARTPALELPVYPGLEQASGSDNSTIDQLYYLFIDSATPAPTLVYASLFLTDFAGHAFGPHGDGVRLALQQTDQRIGALLDLYRSEGVLGETLWVLVSDHGMELQDRSRALPQSQVQALLEAAGVRAVVVDQLLYFRCVQVAAEPATLRRGQENQVVVTVSDDDHGAAVSGARITAGGDVEASPLATSDQSGRATLVVKPTGGRLYLEITHPEFSSERVDLAVGP